MHTPEAGWLAEVSGRTKAFVQTSLPVDGGFGLMPEPGRHGVSHWGGDVGWGFRKRGPAAPHLSLDIAERRSEPELFGSTAEVALNDSTACSPMHPLVASF